LRNFFLKARGRKQLPQTDLKQIGMRQGELLKVAAPVFENDEREDI
jgi:hypothetical protein